MRELDLRNNRIGPESAAYLSDLVRRNTTLTTIDLRWNDLGDVGAKNISVGLDANRTLLRLELQGNKVTDETLSLITPILMRNRGSTLAHAGKESLQTVTRQGEQLVLPFKVLQKEASSFAHEKYQA